MCTAEEEVGVACFLPLSQQVVAVAAVSMDGTHAHTHILKPYYICLNQSMYQTIVDNCELVCNSQLLYKFPLPVATYIHH